MNRNHYDNYEEEEEEEAEEEEEEEEDGHHHDDPDDDAAVADNSRNKRLDRIATLTIPRRVTKAKLHSASTSRGTALLGNSNVLVATSALVNAKAVAGRASSASQRSRTLLV